MWCHRFKSIHDLNGIGQVLAEYKLNFCQKKNFWWECECARPDRYASDWSVHLMGMRSAVNDFLQINSIKSHASMPVILCASYLSIQFVFATHWEIDLYASSIKYVFNALGTLPYHHHPSSYFRCTKSVLSSNYRLHKRQFIGAHTFKCTHSME